MARQKAKTAAESKAPQGLMAAMAKGLAATEVQADAASLPQLIARVAAKAAAAPRGSTARRRLLALHLALLSGKKPQFVVMEAPVVPEPVVVAPEPPPPPPKPPAPTGATTTLSLEDAARMLFAGGDEEEEAPPPTPAAKFAANIGLLSSLDFDDAPDEVAEEAPSDAMVEANASDSAAQTAATGFAAFDDWGFADETPTPQPTEESDPAAWNFAGATESGPVIEGETLPPTAAEEAEGATETTDDSASFFADDGFWDDDEPAAATPETPQAEAEVLPPISPKVAAKSPFMDPMAAFAELAGMDDADSD